MTQFTTQSVLFSEEFHKPVTVTFDQPDSSSDGGAVLLVGFGADNGNDIIKPGADKPVCQPYGSAAG